MAEDLPVAVPDPGNAPPSDWAEDLDPDELADVAKRLRDEFGGEP
jgi:hypothetical protein